VAANPDGVAGGWPSCGVAVTAGDETGETFAEVSTASSV
jgi:hypothetical protein